MYKWDNRQEMLIVLGAGEDQIPVYQRAHKLGIRTIAVDYNPSSPAFKYCDLSIVVSIKDEKLLIRTLKNLELNYKFIGVMTLGVEISPIVSKIARIFGLTAVDELTAHVTTNKCVRSTLLEKNGIPIPKFQVIKTPKNIKMKFPFVIKPSDSSASRGVRRVDSINDLNDSFNEAIKYSTDGRVLVEELLVGSEISIEGFMLNGKMYVTGFADRNYSTIPNSVTQPYFIEDGSTSPTSLGSDIYMKACEVFEKAAKACGITNGPSKGDLIVVNNEVIVIEVTSRLSGGGFCSRIQALQNGTDIVTATIQWHCNMEIDTSLITKQFKKAVAHRFYFHKPGIIKSINVEGVKEMPGVKHFVKQYNFKVGDELKPVSYINRLCYVVTEADDVRTALKYADDAINYLTNSIGIDII